MKLAGIPQVISFDPYSTDSSAETHDLGTYVNIADGRVFRYAIAGASNISRGKLQVAPTPKTNHHNMAPADSTTAVAGSTQVNVTLGATAAVASEYNEGYLTVNLTPGQGQVYKVSYNPAIGSGLSGIIALSDPISVALTTSSRVNLVHNAWNATIEGTVQTKRAAGVPLVSVTASNYYWSQTRGTASVLADQAIALGSLIAPSSSVSGSVIAMSGTFATALATTLVGQANIMAGVDTEYRPVHLMID